MFHVELNPGGNALTALVAEEKKWYTREQYGHCSFASASMVSVSTFLLGCPQMEGWGGGGGVSSMILII